MQNRPFLHGFMLVAALAAVPAARADEPLPAGVPDLTGARGLSLGAYRGVPPTNDGIFFNAAALAARRRYAMEAQWLLDRAGADNALQIYSASVVDSETTSVTSGFAYTRVLSGPWIGNLFHLPIAFPLSGGLFGGLTAKYQSLSGPAGDDMRAVNFDASAFWQASSAFSVGLSGYNLLDAGHKTQQPRALGVGAAFGDDRSFHVAADWRGDFQRRGKLTSLFAVGGELLAADRLPLRASYLHDETRDASFWSIGLGVVTGNGFAIDLAYRQCIEQSGNRTLSAGLKLFLF